MLGRKAKVLLIWAFALTHFQGRNLPAVAQEVHRSSPSGLPDEQLHEILVALAKFDSKLTIIRAPDFSIQTGDLTISVKADKPVVYDGKPYQDGGSEMTLYGQVKVSDRFYGIELRLHYLLLKGGAPYGGASIEERVTILYEDTSRFKPMRPRVFASRPIVIGNDGSFQDLQVFGQFDIPFPNKTLQILRQELVLNSELVATIYIVRTPKEIRLVGYSVPPLVSELVLQ